MPRINIGDKMGDLIALGLSALASILLTRYLLKQLNPQNQANAQAKEEGQRHLERIGVDLSTLSEHEHRAAAQLIAPEDITAQFSDIGGLEAVKQHLQEGLIWPLHHPELLSQSSLLSLPKGILLHGPPGTGKTMLAKAIAKETGCPFLSLSGATIYDMWVGESEKIIRATFSLARKIAPCILFIDEIDSLCRSRSSFDHHSARSALTELMTQWDGLLTDSATRVVVIGATNRPQDLDDAIMRRLPRSFRVSLPSASGRLQILRLILSNEKLEQNFPWEELIALTEDFSGSDLHELCKQAAALCLRRTMASSQNSSSPTQVSLLPLSIEDFRAAIGVVSATHQRMRQARTEVFNELLMETATGSSGTHGFSSPLPELD